MMIQSWTGRDARAIFQGEALDPVPSEVARAARRRLLQLDAAAGLEDLRRPSGNRLHFEAGRWSLSVDPLFRLTFTWTERGPGEVWFGDQL